ncbi:MAG TPA: hypothetical protein VLM78_04955 [Anaerolineales bacterium]|nr:hypothetical protein [Anaerolineales bacterium]
MTDLEKRLHQAMGSMIGNESLAASLDEDAAGDLFSWGEATAKWLVEGTDGMDDAAAEEYLVPRLLALRLMMRAIGRLAGELGSLDAEARVALWDRLGSQARELFWESYILPPMDEIIAELPNAAAREIVMRLTTLFNEPKRKGWLDAA